jgi:IS66 Orf2 like protein
MWRSFNGLSIMAKHVTGRSSFSRHLRVFCNRRSERVKILDRARDEWTIWRKRLEGGSPIQNPNPPLLF